MTISELADWAVAFLASDRLLTWCVTGAALFASKKAAQAKADDAETWEDTFWPRLLKKLDHNKHNALRDDEG